MVGSGRQVVWESTLQKYERNFLDYVCIFMGLWITYVYAFLKTQYKYI